ncbi:IclR family transcriptional regulator [Streptomyces phaeochromogenes]
MPRTSEPGRTVGSRLLEVLFAFQPGHTALSLADLVRKTGMPHATVRRLAMELADFGALDRRPDGRFTVGLRLWRLGTLAPLTESLRTLAQPFLEDLYTALHQHVQLAVLEGRQAVIIERLSAPEAPELVSQVGGRLPLHCTGVGKVLLSHGGTELIEAVLSGELREYAPRSIVAPEVLRKEFADCRRTGTATVREELTPGRDSVAMRIVNGEGRVVAALSVVVRTDSVKHEAVLPSVIASGLGISRLLGWRPGVKVRNNG